MSTAALRPRSAPELIDAVVRVLRRHYLELLTVAALYMVLAIVGLTLSLIFFQFVTPSFAGTAVSSALLVVTWVLGFTGVIAMNEATTTVIVASAYLGQPVSIAMALRQAWRRFLPATIVTVLRFAAIGAGTLLLFVPGMLAACYFFAGISVLTIEGASPIASLRRSRELARGSVGRVFCVLALCAIIVVIIRLTVVMTLVLLVPGLHAGSPTASAIGDAMGLLSYPFLIAGTTLLYFDLRIRNEGFDIALMAGGIDPSSIPLPNSLGE